MSKMLLNRFVFTCFFILFSSFLTAQTQKELEKMTNMELVSAFSNEKDTIIQIKYSKAFIKKNKKANNNLMIAKGFYMLSLIHETNLSIKYLDSVIYYSSKTDDDLFPMVAYFEKAAKLDRKLEFKEAIDNYIFSENEAIKNNNLDYYYNSKLSIAIIKSEDLGETEEALTLYRKCFKYYSKNVNIDENHSENYLRTIYSLSDGYKTLKQLKMATFYNKLGYKESIKFKNERLQYLFVLSEGANQSLYKNYKSAIDSINKAMPFLIKYQDKGNVLAAHFYIAKSYNGLGNVEKTITNYIKIDSLNKISNYITPEFTNGYRYLIDYYKKKGDTPKQLYYINTLMSIDSTFQKNYRELFQKIKKEYDIPHLMQEKESIIRTLKNDKKTNYYVIIILGFLVLSALIFSIKQVQQKKKYKQLFDNLMASIPEEEYTNLGALVMTEPNLKDSKKTLDISDEVVLDITSKLKVFEKEKQFLSASISIQSLAQDFNTNTKYLSSIINHTFQKSFTHYINDLRIDYIVKELKSNKQLRKFTINSIAEEAGFNTGESFSKAFFKRTGIKPSYFIKEINKT